MGKITDDTPVGTKVIYTEDDGQKTHTATRSEVYDLGIMPNLHRMKVVLLEGKTGGYDIERIEVEQ